MSSSSDLIMEALRSLSQRQQQPQDQSAMQPPPVMQQGLPPMPAAPAAPYAPPMAGQQPMQQPMQDQMQQPMQQPMPDQSMQQPMQQPSPYDQPYGDQQAAQEPAQDMGAAPLGYQDGGTVDPVQAPEDTGFNFDVHSALNYPALLPSMLINKFVNSRTKAAAPESETPEEAISADIVTTATELAGEIDTAAPEDIGAKILDKAAEKGVESTGDLKFDLASIYERLTGDASGYEKNIDTLNRGIIGAAIASGTSARATENISKGLLVGLQGAKDTEERRAADEQAINVALFGAALKPEGAKGTQARDYRSPTDAYQDVYQGIMLMSQDDMPLIPGTSEPVDRKAYAAAEAEKLVLQSYTAEQLKGTPFENLKSPTSPPPPDGGTTPAVSGSPEEDKILQQARAALAANKSRAAVEDYLTSMGIDPSKL